MEEIYIREKTLKAIFPIEMKDLASDSNELCSISADDNSPCDYYLNREKKTTRTKKMRGYLEKLSIVMTVSYIVEIVKENSCVSLIIDDKAFSFSISKNFGTTMLLIKSGKSAKGIDIDEADTMAIADEILNTIGREALEAACVYIDLPGAAFNMLSEKNMYNILLEDYIYINGVRFVNHDEGDFEFDESEIPIFA